MSTADPPPPPTVDEIAARYAALYDLPRDRITAKVREDAPTIIDVVITLAVPVLSIPIDVSFSPVRPCHWLTPACHAPRDSSTRR